MILSNQTMCARAGAHNWKQKSPSALKRRERIGFERRQRKEKGQAATPTKQDNNKKIRQEQPKTQCTIVTEKRNGISRVKMEYDNVQKKNWKEHCVFRILPRIRPLRYNPTPTRKIAMVLFSHGCMVSFRFLIRHHQLGIVRLPDLENEKENVE